MLTVTGISKTIGDRKVLDNVSFTILPRQKVAFVGSDPLAKTTLFKILMEEIEPDEGTFKWGVTTSRSYLPTDNSAYFDGCEDSLIDWVRSYSNLVFEADIRSWLGRMMFSGEEATKKANVLSGGERVRCMLCKMMLSGANVLLLDEPTNHLDLNSKEVLEAALNDFGGTVIFISHDRYLLNKVPDKIVEITRDGAVVYDGNYEYYKERSQQQAKAAEPPKETKEKTDGGYRSREMRRADAMRKQQIKQIEDEISYLEQTCKTLEEELSCEEVYSSFELTREKSLELESANKRLEECFEEWEKLSEE